MSQNKSRNLPDRLYRIVLIVAAAVIFGLLFYWISPDLTPYVGENGAALWSWALIVFSGIAAHWLLPRKNLAPVSRVLFALLTSAVVAMLGAWILMLVVDLPVDQGEIPQVLVTVGLLALAFASIVFVPFHLLRKKLGRSVAFIYLLTGTFIPAGCVMFWRPAGQHDLVANSLLAVFLGLIGGCCAIGFAIAAARFRSGSIAQP
ncbi:MAG: hypothetical protein QNI98_02475 [Woeseiaceae bacterium]|nr:hypothetical protein [Woeseiaceae bacterium]